MDLHTTFNSSSSSSSSSSSKFGAFIIQTTEPPNEYDSEANIKLYKLSSGDHGDDDKKMVFKVDDLRFLPFYKDYLLHYRLCMVGSCNGIICLHDPEVMNDNRGRHNQQHYYSYYQKKQHYYSNLRDISLWNPATRQFRILPKSIPIQEKQISISNWLEDFIAFRFDVKTKDYKVLRITPWERLEGGCKCRVQVYSLSTDSWRLLEEEGIINSLPVVPNQGMFPNGGIYLNGSYFFVGRKQYYTSNSMMLLSFDFTKQIFTTMQLPENYSRHDMVLSSLGDKLALFDGCSMYYYDIWVLNEQHGSSSSSGQGASWTKLHSTLLFRIKEEQNEQMKGEPRCISNNGEFALISTWENDKLQLFNLVTKEAIKDFTIGTRMCRVEVYKESLVSIMGGGNVLFRWQLPTHGTTYILNLDAPFIDSSSSFGIGLCLTSDTGGCIGVRSLKTYDVRHGEDGEAMAMLEAIKWAKELELSPIIIESDSEDCVSFFMDDDYENNLDHWSSKALSLLGEAKLLINSSEIGIISFQYCYRNCNYVADIAAKLGRERLSWSCMDWTAKFPGEMVRSLSKDFASKTW